MLLRNAPVLVSKPKSTTVVAGKEVTFSFDVQSNSSDVLSMVYVDVRYPVGFIPKHFSPNPANTSGTEWRFPGLQPGAKKTVTITGTIRGGEQALQAISAQARVAPSGESFRNAITVSSEEDVVDVGEAFLDVHLRLSGQAKDRIVVSPNTVVRADVRWFNQDSSRLHDLVLTASVAGTGLDEAVLLRMMGDILMRCSGRLCGIRRATDRFLRCVLGRVVVFLFLFRVLPDLAEFAQAQKYIQVHISARARRGETNTVEQVEDIAVARADVRSVLQVVGNTLYSTSAVRNSGPLPPQIGRETTYVLKYFLKNSGNVVSQVDLVIPLGRGIVLTDVTSGIALSEWEYDEYQHAVVARIPLLTASGPRSRRSIEFQVAVKPQSRDVGRHIVLAKRATIVRGMCMLMRCWKGVLVS